MLKISEEIIEDVALARDGVRDALKAMEQRGHSTKSVDELAFLVHRCATLESALGRLTRAHDDMTGKPVDRSAPMPEEMVAR